MIKRIALPQREKALELRTHRNTIRRLQAGRTLSITPWSMGAMVALVLALLGLLMALYLVVGLEH